ncbi:TSUP family transporter [Methylobacterium crusticola]|uniref:TSUP family transporter n=1 Tax=Methylobacterium crusticola TaxID=1697972 RepID=UPI001396AF16|nr:TSUP family transporter [Methylobacterium crusticola]
MTAFSPFAGLSADPPAAALLLAAALVGGLVRGFTGFGFAMVFVPLAAAAVGPAEAVGLIWVVDAPFALGLGALSARRAAWREVVPLLVGASALLPAGVWLLTRPDPDLTRWITAAAIAAALGALVSGWRYRGVPSLALSLATGGASGLASGFAALGGMPLAVFWLAGQRAGAAQVRDNLMAYFGLSTLVSGLVFAATGVLSAPRFAEALPLLLPYGLGLLLGARGFRHASDALFRRVAYAVILAAVCLALPLR